jgi:hypothetical protein
MKMEKLELKEVWMDETERILAVRTKTGSYNVYFLGSHLKNSSGAVLPFIQELMADAKISILNEKEKARADNNS